MRKYESRRRTLALAPDCRAESGRLRPTADRLRESLFKSWRMPMAIRSPARACSTCLPAPARSASRRCRAARPIVLFVDDGVEARALLRDNAETLGLGGATRIFRRDATKLGPVYPLEPFSLYFSIRPIARAWRKRR